jgi:hypothetical protein
MKSGQDSVRRLCAAGTMFVASLFAYAQCFLPTPVPQNGSEAAPCLNWAANGCSSYQSCPSNDLCSAAACGWNGCGVQGVILQSYCSRIRRLIDVHSRR